MVQSQFCKLKTQCHFPIKTKELGDPAKGCDKNFVWEYKCVGEVESSRSGTQDTREVEGIGLHLKEGVSFVFLSVSLSFNVISDHLGPQRWDNTYCDRPRVPICQLS